jgi:hypothetical protein
MVVKLILLKSNCKTTSSAAVIANAATRYMVLNLSHSFKRFILHIIWCYPRFRCKLITQPETATYPTTLFTDADNNWTAAEFNNTNKDNEL